MTERRKLFFASLGIALLVGALFAQAIRFPLLCWDDEHHVQAALSWLTRPLGYPIPLTVASWALLGRSALAAHAWNLPFHAATAIALLALSWQLKRGVWPAALFAIHPLVAEPVAWATGRKDLLAAGLVVAAIALHAQKVRPLVTALLYVLALAAKPSAVTLPAILWAYDRLLAPERKSAWLLALVPIGALDAWLAATGDAQLGGIRDTPLAIWLRVPLVAGLQAGHLFAPIGLLPRYMPEAAELPIALGALALAALIALPIFLRQRAPVAAFAIAFAALAYLPAADLLHRTRFLADSYLYLPLAGLALCMGSQRIPRWAPPLLAALYVPLCFAQTRAWRSNVTLFAPVTEAYGDSPTAWKQLGDSYVCDDRVAEAVPIYESIERTFPGNTIACGNLGLAYARLGDLARAEAAFTRGAAGGDPKAAQHLSKLRESMLHPSGP